MMTQPAARAGNRPSFGSRRLNVRSRGFTLLEITLVLALVVVAFALAIPRLREPLAGQRLRSGGERIRTAMTKARHAAMRQGAPYSLRCEINGARYLAAPLNDETGTSSYLPTAPEEVGIADTVASDFMLPEGVTFQDVQVIGDTRSSFTATQAESTSTTAQQSGGDWSSPIYFFADGTTSSAQVTVAGDFQQKIRIVLRGLTGSARVQEVEANPEAL